MVTELFQAFWSYSKSNINEENQQSWNVCYNFVYSKKFETFSNGTD